MDTYDLIKLFDILDTVIMYTNTEFERLCNNEQYADARIFKSIRDSNTHNIRLLQSYVINKAESEEKENDKV